MGVCAVELRVGLGANDGANMMGFESNCLFTVNSRSSFIRSSLYKILLKPPRQKSNHSLGRCVHIEQTTNDVVVVGRNVVAQYTMYNVRYIMQKRLLNFQFPPTRDATRAAMLEPIV